jgi:hypothetical protein
MTVSVVATALMPISQAVAWYMVLQSNIADRRSIYSAVWKISAFYCAWALFNRFFQGVTEELGMYSMGFLAVASFFQKKIFSIIGTVLVLLNFGLPAYSILIAWGPSELAETVKNSDTELAIIWAYIFKLYFVSNFCLWGLVLRKFSLLEDPGYGRIEEVTLPV